MTLSLWRYGHLVLAIVSFLFLLILSATGVILAIDAINEKTQGYRIENFDSVNVAQVIPNLYKVYPEIIELSVNHNQYVIIEATDQDGNSVKSYINPLTGKVLGPALPKSQFIDTTVALHRSLFLHETGRIIVGIVSFLLFLITISGFILIIKRQQGLRNFFVKINKDFLAQYFHVASGRLALIPILLLSLTGTYLFLSRIELIKKPNVSVKVPPVSESTAERELADFPIFQKIRLSEVEKIEFPFMPDDPDEFFVLKLADRVITVNQLNGEVIEETHYPNTAYWEKLSLDLHTGRTNLIWAAILGLASLNIIAFIYSGFVITFRRKRTKIRNKFTAGNAEIVILVGTENGSTLFFANQIHHQLLAAGKSSLLTEMNKYQAYPKSRHFLIFTSTYGLGTAPSNATHFEQLLLKTPQVQPVNFTIIGFGSRAYADYCGYAKQLDQLLERQPWALRYLELYTVNDKSTDEFVKWVHAWSEQSLIALTTAPTHYNTKIERLKTLEVVENVPLNEDGSLFKVLLKTNSGKAFQSGDLLAIYPANDNRERFYSIGKNSDRIQLIVKLHPDGLGSGYLHRLRPNEKIKARIEENSTFHFPENARSVTMIANGTGIAPFLGMINNNNGKTPINLYAGFRHNDAAAKYYRDFAEKEVAVEHLTNFKIAYSREANSTYVMDLIRDDAQLFAYSLENEGVIMICGSLAMHRDVEIVLNEICQALNNKSLGYYIANDQLLSDCY